MAKGIIALSVMIIIVGCVSSGTKVSQQQLTQFEVGKTTEAQVIAALGEPTSRSVSTDGTKTDVYQHISAHANAASFIPVVGIFAGGAKSTADTAVLHFDQTGILVSTSSATAHTNVNTGIANQH